MFDVCGGRKCEGAQPTPGAVVRQVQPARGLKGNDCKTRRQSSIDMCHGGGLPGCLFKRVCQSAGRHAVIGVYHKQRSQRTTNRPGQGLGKS